jgi:hypothetical protein
MMKIESKIESTWGFYGELPKEDEKLIDNYNAFNALMESLDFSGVFSEQLIKKIYTYANRALAIARDYASGKITHDETEVKSKEVFMEFYNLLNAYTIFSMDFKINCKGFFLTILRRP